MINIENLSNHIRKLAKGNYWQTIYTQSKEVNGLQLFKNNYDFTDLQIEFLNNLSFYNSIYMDIALGDVTKLVFEDYIYEDSYIYFKNHNRAKDKKTPATQPKEILKGKNKQEIVEKDKFIFRKSKQ